MSNKYQAMTVYKASAGAGKTFTLAVRFIELLITKPEAYRETLAVTFTNKATEEMKARILSQLYGLWKQLDDSKDYMQRIHKDLGKDESFISAQAGKALTLMIHDYSYFNIETIDAFFQRVLRNLAKEMNLNANLRVELNDSEIEEQAVDKLIADLTETDPVLNWILGYIDDNIAEDKGWNVIDSIKKFGKKIFSDEYKRVANELQERFDEKDFFGNYRKALRDIINNGNKKMEDYAGRFEKALADNGFTIDDLSRKSSGAAGFFLKLGRGEYDNDVWNSYAQKAADSPGGWVGAKIKPGNPLYDFAEQQLVPLINEANEVRLSIIKDVNTAKAIVKNLNELRLLSKIKSVVNELNLEENRFLLSDTQNMLNRMMIESDAPFIFEKIGGPLRNIMIDEFQDTSTIQWENFHTLLLDCIAKAGSQNLIVGDVKQSIYRWRNGDWKLLHSQLAGDRHLQAYGFKEEPLNDNYRSEGNIINFNNAFFLQASLCEKAFLESKGNENSQTLEDIYKDVRQLIPEAREPKDCGLVDIRLLTDSDKDTDYKDSVMEIVCEHLTTLFDSGATDDSVCILARNNFELSMMAEKLQETFPEHSFVSDEAFKLEASAAVNIIITAIRVLNHPGDNLSKAQLAKFYQEKILDRHVSEVFFRETDDLNRYLPIEFIDNRAMLLTKPLTDLVEELFRIFNLKKLDGEAAYVMAFYDQLSTFAQNNIPDLELLLDYWEESMHKKTVKGGALSGVRLLTIHKSKGLEADHVFIPFCDWALDRYGSDLWCSTNKKPFGELPVVPVNSKSLDNSHFQKEYDDETLQVSIDNMNMLYVAFTRARKNLFVIARKPGATSTSTRARLLMDTLMSMNLDGSQLTGDPKSKTGDIHFTYGSLCIGKRKEKHSDNIFLQTAANQEVIITQEDNHLEFRQSNASRKFVEPEEEDTTRMSYTSTGTLLHNLLARIKDAGEVDKVLNEFVQEGLLSESDPVVNREKLSKMIRSRIETNAYHPEVNRWFSADVEVFNECTLIGRDEQTGVIKEFRPDRVVKDGDEVTVIDYKFGKHAEEYKTQVRQYISLLNAMGYRNVKGYLWYVYKNEIENV